jgi:hypothetical protein
MISNRERFVQPVGYPRSVDVAEAQANARMRQATGSAKDAVEKSLRLAEEKKRQAERDAREAAKDKAKVEAKKEATAQSNATTAIANAAANAAHNQQDPFRGVTDFPMGTAEFAIAYLKSFALIVAGFVDDAAQSSQRISARAILDSCRIPLWRLLRDQGVAFDDSETYITLLADAVKLTAKEGYKIEMSQAAFEVLALAVQLRDVPAEDLGHIDEKQDDGISPAWLGGGALLAAKLLHFI